MDIEPQTSALSHTHVCLKSAYINMKKNDSEIIIWKSSSKRTGFELPKEDDIGNDG